MTSARITKNTKWKLGKGALAAVAAGSLLSVSLSSRADPPAAVAPPPAAPATPAPAAKPAAAPVPVAAKPAAEVPGQKPAPAPEPVQALAPLASRDVVERLKSIRSELVLEEEQSRLLKARLERMELEALVAAAEAKRLGVPAKAVAPTVRPVLASTPKVAAENPLADLVVKAVTVRPFKEAIVTYRGRVYTVRPKDRLGPLEIQDITESGVVASGMNGSGQSVLLGR